MAGAQSEEENPVSINVVPLIDVLFCIAIFFFCSIHFKSLEGRIESWLPKDKGLAPTHQINPATEDIRVFLEWKDGRTVRSVGATKINDTDKRAGNKRLAQLVKDAYQNAMVSKGGREEIPVSIDAGQDVPWHEVITVMDLCKGVGIKKIEFAGKVGYKVEDYLVK